MIRPASARFRLIALVVAVAFGGAAGCSAKKDMRYLESKEIADLVIPDRLGTPVHATTMAIPRPSVDNIRPVPADETSLRALEKPPRRIPPLDGAAP